MATIIPLAQHIFQFDGVHLVVSKVRQATASDSFTVPGGNVSAAAVGPSGATTATITNSQGADAAEDSSGLGNATAGTVTIAGGDVGIDYLVVSRHTGNAAGL
jgi:hypothetical protein